MTIHTKITVQTVCAVLLAFFLVSSGAEAASVLLYGFVRDTTGARIPNATLLFVSDFETVTVATNKNGYYGFYIYDNHTGIREQSEPIALELSQNYPNPFNPTTTIQYVLGNTAPVHLDIYSVTGQHVRTLVDETFSPGRHSVVWDGHDDAGRGVSAGVYIYRLRTGSQTVSKKMLLLDGAVSADSAVPVFQHVGKSAHTQASRTYTVYVTKSSMQPFVGTCDVSFDTSQIQQDYTIPDRYRSHELYCDSPRLFSQFGVIGDTIGLTLVHFHDPLPWEGMVTLMSGSGDVETVSISGSGDYIRSNGFGSFANRFEDCRQGSIISSSGPAVHYDGVLQTNTVSDTAFAWYVNVWGDTLHASIPLIESIETVTLWDYTYSSWREGEWYIGTPDDTDWWPTDGTCIEIQFTSSTTENDETAFLQEHNLEISYHRTPHSYLLTVPENTHPVEVLMQISDSYIIESALASSAIIVGPAKLGKQAR